MKYHAGDGHTFAAVHMNVSAEDGVELQDIRNLVVDATADFLDEIGEQQP